MNLFIDNFSAIQISKNHVQHSRTKHIDLLHHFIRDLGEDKVIPLEYVETTQLTDIFTIPLDAKKFEHLRSSIGMCQLS